MLKRPLLENKSQKVNPANKRKQRESINKMRQQVDKYELNLQLVGSVQFCGGGATQAQTILSHMGLPCTSVQNHFRNLKDAIGREEIEVEKELQQEALEEEIRLTLEKEGGEMY